MNARAAGCAGNVGRRTTRMNVRIQPELFAQNAGRKKCQETRLYLEKRNEHRLGAGRSYPRELGRWHTSVVAALILWFTHGLLLLCLIRMLFRKRKRRFSNTKIRLAVDPKLS